MPNTQHLGAYVLTEQLRQDATGTVHRGVHGTSNDPVTVRVLNEQHSKDPELVARFGRAVEALRRIEHPGIARVIDHGEAPEGLYLVMESLTGETLAERLKREPRLPLEETQRIVGAVASALATAHRLKLVHRALTADSIFLVKPAAEGEPAEVKLLDLGLARLVDAEIPSNKTAASSRGIDKRADIQALGRLAYLMLSGEAPVESSADEAGAQNGKRPAKLSTFGVTVPGSVEAAILRALARKKKRRFSSITEFAHAVGADVEAPVLASPEPEVEVELELEPEVEAAPGEPEAVVELADADVDLVDRPQPPPLPAPKGASSTSLISASVREGGRAWRRPKVAIAAAASVAVLATGWLALRPGDQPATSIAVNTPPPAAVKAASVVDVARAAPPPSAPNRVDEILALNQQAVNAYGQGDVKAARGLLFQADKLAIDSGYKDAPVRAQTQVRLGALFVAQKKPRLGRPYLARAVAINPAVRLPPELMNPQIHKTLIATKQKARLAKAGSAKRGKGASGRRPGLRKG